MDLPNLTEVISMDNKELEANKEKRMHERSDCKGIIKWSYFINTAAKYTKYYLFML